MDKVQKSKRFDQLSFNYEKTNPTITIVGLEGSSKMLGYKVDFTM